MSDIFREDIKQGGGNEIYRKADGLWYHADECWCDEFGPFKTRAKAEQALEKYCYWLDHGPTLWQRIWWPILRIFK